MQDKIERALGATRTPYAGESWSRARTQIDGYLARWRTMHTRTCEATRIRGEQSESVMEARMACLEQRRNEVRALTQVLVQADAEVAKRAATAATDLTSLDVCENVSSLTAVRPEPTDPAARAELAALRQDLARTKASLDAGLFGAGLDQAKALVERARRLGYAPVTAEALLQAARAKAVKGAVAEALPDAEAALGEADAGRDDALRLRAAARLVTWDVTLGHAEEAERWSRVAEAVVRRIDGETPGKVEWRMASGWRLYSAGKFGEAIAPLREAVDTARRIGADPTLPVSCELMLAQAHAALGHYGEARRLLDDAEQQVIGDLGSDHPDRVRVIVVRSNLAGQANDGQGELEAAQAAVLFAQRVDPENDAVAAAWGNVCDARVRIRDYDGAVVDCAKAAEADQRVFGSDSAAVANVSVNAGDALAGLRRYDDASVSYRKALAIDEHLGVREAATLLPALAGLGRARLGAGHPGEAVPLLERALGIATQIQEPSANFQLLRGQAGFALAQALSSSGRTRRAEELARAAAQAFRDAAAEDEARRVESWLGPDGRVIAGRGTP
jgi:tetratricopeptide (TPR) repeat protein